MDHYKVLNVLSNATITEIKKQYKLLANKYHPDKNPNTDTTAQFHKINEAYKVLSNQEKRRSYDWTLANASIQKWATLSKSSNVNHAIRSTDISVSLVEAFTGGLIKTYTGLTLTIPKGIRNNTRIQHNNAFYDVSVRPHDKFKRANDDLLIDLHITVTEAMTGIEVEFTHLDNTKITFNVPAGVQHDQVIKLTGKGMPNPKHNRRGDLLFKCLLAVPKTLTTEQYNAIINICNRKSIKI